MSYLKVISKNNLYTDFVIPHLMRNPVLRQAQDVRWALNLSKNQTMDSRFRGNDRVS